MLTIPIQILTMRVKIVLIYNKQGVVEITLKVAPQAEHFHGTIITRFRKELQSDLRNKDGLLQIIKTGHLLNQIIIQLIKILLLLEIML